MMFEEHRTHLLPTKAVSTLVGKFGPNPTQYKNLPSFYACVRDALSGLAGVGCIVPSVESGSRSAAEPRVFG